MVRGMGVHIPQRCLSLVCVLLQSVLDVRLLLPMAFCPVQGPVSFANTSASWQAPILRYCHPKLLVVADMCDVQ